MSELLKEALANMQGKKAVVTTGIIKEVKGNTCTVKRENLPDLLDVRLNAIDGSLQNKIIVKPAAGSKVLCAEIDGVKEESAIIKYSEIDSILIEVDGAKLELQSGKIAIKNTEANLGALIGNLLEELIKATILTPAGPGNFSPSNITKFQELNVKTKKLLQ